MTSLQLDTECLNDIQYHFYLKIIFASSKRMQVTNIYLDIQIVVFIVRCVKLCINQKFC